MNTGKRSRSRSKEITCLDLWGRRGNDHCSGYIYYVVPPLSRHVMKIIIIIIIITFYLSSSWDTSTLLGNYGFIETSFYINQLPVQHHHFTCRILPYYPYLVHCFLPPTIQISLITKPSRPATLSILFSTY